MYAALHRLLADRKGGEIFVLFGSWHLLYMGLTVLGIAVLLRILRNKSNAAREKIAYAFLCAAFGLYIVDFFLMPLAYNEIDIEKLPFHVCTAMCVMSFLSCHIPFLGKYRASFALLGFVSNLVYLIYPAGVMWHEVHPVSYRVIQTLLFHSVMTVYGFLSLYYGQDKLSVGSCCRDAGVVAAMTLWAMLGNAVYNGNSENYSHFSQRWLRTVGVCRIRCSR